MFDLESYIFGNKQLQSLKVVVPICLPPDLDNYVALFHLWLRMAASYIDVLFPCNWRDCEQSFFSSDLVRGVHTHFFRASPISPSVIYLQYQYRFRFNTMYSTKLKVLCFLINSPSVFLLEPSEAQILAK